MKIKQILLLLAGLAVAGSYELVAWAQSSSMVAHEWGTFTSFQGGDGVLLSWKPLQTSKLPKFVYNWNTAGFGRQPTSMMLLAGKGSLVSLQRMETPVIYFYSEQKQNVDVSVDFPDGLITEWYPQAAQIGPSALGDSSANTASPAPSGLSPTLHESRIHWANVNITPNQYAQAIPAKDDSGSHYFAARETDSAIVDAPTTHAGAVETEKFLFYRGVGNFKTPLHVVMKSEDGVDLANTGGEPLLHLFVLVVKGNIGRFVYVPEIPAGGVKVVNIGDAGQSQPLDKLSENLGREMSAALVKTGLYPREAAAMMNTWKDSWFAEPGVRVLYVLPRAWTDQTLPITINPAPKELVRTMVGRAEIFPPGLEHDLASLIQKVKQGDAQASIEARELLKGLGRFAEPAFGRVLAAAPPKPEEAAFVSAILQPQNPPN